MAALPRADHRARLLAGGAVCAARAQARAGHASSAALVLVALIVLAFALGTDYEFSTYGLIPTAAVTCALTIGLLRAAYESFASEPLACWACAARSCSWARARRVMRLHRTLGARRNGIALRLPRRRHPGRRAGPRAARGAGGSRRGAAPDAAGRARHGGGGARRAHRARCGRDGAPLRACGCGSRRRTTELLVQRGEYVPGQGAPLFELRPPVLTGTDWALEARVRHRRQRARRGARASRSGSLIALALKLDSRGPIFYVDRRIGVGEREFGMLKFRTMVAGAEATAGRARAAQRGRGRALQDPRRPARHPRRRRCCGGSRSTSCRRS